MLVDGNTAIWKFEYLRLTKSWPPQNSVVHSSTAAWTLKLEEPSEKVCSCLYRVVLSRLSNVFNALYISILYFWGWLLVITGDVSSQHFESNP
jgi:hypothetical protein